MTGPEPARFHDSDGCSFYLIAMLDSGMQKTRVLSRAAYLVLQPMLDGKPVPETFLLRRLWD
jgi:hypothetical protein